jgi:hypothetical protein
LEWIIYSKYDKHLIPDSSISNPILDKDNKLIGWKIDNGGNYYVEMSIPKLNEGSGCDVRVLAGGTEIYIIPKNKTSLVGVPEGVLGSELNFEFKIIDRKKNTTYIKHKKIGIPIKREKIGLELISSETYKDIITGALFSYWTLSN